MYIQFDSHLFSLSDPLTFLRRPDSGSLLTTARRSVTKARQNGTGRNMTDTPVKHGKSNCMRRMNAQRKQPLSLTRVSRVPAPECNRRANGRLLL